MTRKEELELRAAQWLQHHGDQRLTRPLAALLEQVEREVLQRVKTVVAKKQASIHPEHTLEFKSGAGNVLYDVEQWVRTQQQELI